MKRHARQRREYDLRLLGETLLFGLALVVIVALASLVPTP
jgi:hypothetical protein